MSLISVCDFFSSFFYYVAKNCKVEKNRNSGTPGINGKGRVIGSDDVNWIQMAQSNVQ
jgi:hypothetical protein